MLLVPSKTLIDRRVEEEKGKEERKKG